MQHHYKKEFEKDILIVDGLWPHSFMASEMPKCKLYINSIKILAKISRISSFGIEVLIPKSVFEELDILKIDAKIEFSVFGNHIVIDSLDTYEHCTSNNSVSFIFLFNTVPIYTMPFLLEIALKLIFRLKKVLVLIIVF